MFYMGSNDEECEYLLRILESISGEKPVAQFKLINVILSRLNNSNTEDVDEALSCCSAATIEGIGYCHDINQQDDTMTSEVILANHLSNDDLSQDDQTTLLKVSKLYGIFLDSEGKPSDAALEKVANQFNERYSHILIEVQRLENLCLSLKISEPRKV